MKDNCDDLKNNDSFKLDYVNPSSEKKKYIKIRIFKVDFMLKRQINKMKDQKLVHRD